MKRWRITEWKLCFWYQLLIYINFVNLLKCFYIHFPFWSETLCLNLVLQIFIASFNCSIAFFKPFFFHNLLSLLDYALSIAFCLNINYWKTFILLNFPVPFWVKQQFWNFEIYLCLFSSASRELILSSFDLYFVYLNLFPPTQNNRRSRSNTIFRIQSVTQNYTKRYSTDALLTSIMPRGNTKRRNMCIFANYIINYHKNPSSDIIQS